MLAYGKILWRFSLVLMVAGGMSCGGTDGKDGALGPEGPGGLTGADGPQGPDGVGGSDGVDGVDGADGLDGDTGQSGQSCWDLNANGSGDVATEDTNGDTAVNILDCLGATGATGPAGAGYVALEPNGIVGFVRDTAGYPVAGAKVYLVPASDIPTTALSLKVISTERASTVDEPLEDTIALNGGSYEQATADDDGVYRIASVPTDSYFIVVMPADTDTEHLPGGSLCREAKASASLVGTQQNIVVSTAPSADAEYVGPSVCLNCHGATHETQTLHANGIREIGKAGALQNGSRFPDWNEALAKFGNPGTVLYFYDYASSDWRVSETNPGSNVSFTATLYSDGTTYAVKLADVKGSSGYAWYNVELSYGGGIYKQRYLTKIGSSRYVLPIQYNFDAKVDESVPTQSGRWTWVQYNAGNWYTENGASSTLVLPYQAKSFDSNCAGCHFSGFSLTGTSPTNTTRSNASDTGSFVAHGVEDAKGDYDYDGDGDLEMMNISCETCHGPGSEHWYQTGQGNAIVSPQLLTPEREVTICAQCHTRALGKEAYKTEAPMNASREMIRAGTSRKEFLTNYVSKLDDGLWNATTQGDGKHSQKHHQQASDFLKTAKYRNPNYLMTCATCHDPHGNTGLSHQINDTLDTVVSGDGMCIGCHDATFPAGATLGLRMQTHYATTITDTPGHAKPTANTVMGDISCVDCHMAKTAKSGAGAQEATINSVVYFRGDISSHLFDVPLRSEIPSATRASAMMPIPYTRACGAACHVAVP